MAWWVNQLTQEEIVEFLILNELPENTDASVILDLIQKPETTQGTYPIFDIIIAKNYRHLNLSKYSDEYLINYMGIDETNTVERLEKIKKIIQTYKDSTITIITLNVQFYKDDSEGKIYERLNKYDVDIICLQEDIKTTFENNRLSNYLLAQQCIAEQLIGDIHLLNTIYVSPRLKIIKTETVDITVSGNMVPRCASVLTFKKGLKTIKIANTHLTGGRYDDPNFRNLIDVRTNQIKRLIDQKVNLIIGDFNSEYNKEDAINQLNKYPLYKSLNDKDKSIFLKYYQGWSDLINKNEYVPVFQTEDVGPTSKFGGNPDWIFYKLKTYILPIDTSLIDILSSAPQITDHNGIIVDFLI